METFKNINWINSCTKCGTNQASVQTKKGDKDWLYAGDKVACDNCGHTGVIKTGNEYAWCVWDEVDD